MEMSSTTSKKSNTRETRTWKKSTDQERKDIALFLRQRMNAEGILPPGSINEAAQHFGRNRHMIGNIYKELKPKSVHERQHVIPDQERQDIELFLRQRMNVEGSVPPGTINEAAHHFSIYRSSFLTVIHHHCTDYLCSLPFALLSRITAFQLVYR
jgi:hypothetical protein